MSRCECCEGIPAGKDIRVSFCPECKSRSVGYVFGFGNIFGVIPKMRCRDCGFSAATFPILVTSEEKLKKTVEDMKTKVKKVKKIKKAKKVVKRK